MQDATSALRAVMDKIENAVSGADVLGAIPEYARALEECIALGLGLDRRVKDAHEAISVALNAGVWVGEAIGASLGRIVASYVDVAMNNMMIWDVLDDAKLFIFSPPQAGPGVDVFVKIIQEPIGELVNRLVNYKRHTGEEVITNLVDKKFNPGILLNSKKINIDNVLDIFLRKQYLRSSLKKWDRFDEYLKKCFRSLATNELRFSDGEMKNFAGARYTELALGHDEYIGQFEKFTYVDVAISKMESIGDIDFGMLNKCIESHSSPVKIELFRLIKRTIERNGVEDLHPERVAKVVKHFLMTEVKMAFDIFSSLSHGSEENIKSVLKFMGMGREEMGSAFYKLMENYEDFFAKNRILSAVEALKKENEDTISVPIELLEKIEDKNTLMVDRISAIDKFSEEGDESKIKELERIILNDPVLCVACATHGSDMAATGIVSNKAYKFVSNIKYVWAAIGQNKITLPTKIKISLLANTIMESGIGNLPDCIYVENISTAIMGMDDVDYIFNAITIENREDLLIDFIPAIAQQHCGILAAALSNKEAAWPLVDMLLTQCKMDALGELKLNDGYRNVIAERIGELPVGNGGKTLGDIGFVPKMPKEIEEAWALVRTSLNDTESLGLVIKQGLAKKGPDLSIPHHFSGEIYSFECGV